MFSSTVLKRGVSLLLPFVLLGCNAQAEPEQKAVESVHVDTLTLSSSTLRLTKELPGRISAFKQAEVRPQVSGIVIERLFEEGSYVNSGDLLYQIDSTSYQATVNSAKAQLDKAIANENTTQKAAVRYSELLKKNLTSQVLSDEATSAYQQAVAEVAIRQADLDNANIELSYTQVKAPISGKIGISQVSEGSLVTSGQSAYLTTIIQSDHVYVDMQQSSLSLYKIQQEFIGQEHGDIDVPVSVTLEDGTQYGEIGYLAFSDAHVDDSTGSVTLRAVIPNSNHALLSGMFVRATISMPVEKDYLVVPQSTVVRSQSGEPSVFVVDETGLTEKKPVVLGNEIGNGWVVEEGLVAGDKIVVSNLIRVKNNQSVIIDTDTDVNGDIIYTASVSTH
ncbi:efflux RND transporter periplasmic adaptor subunit [Vibrio sp. 10N.261.51.F12]|uniref:efflux RND transporter periplasmic adaptor subunit n=1 Tax=Vibrio sp. 10N.261.51.F12 TaxID=3229679 RepID=UPI00354EF3CD